MAKTKMIIAAMVLVMTSAAANFAAAHNELGLLSFSRNPTCPIPYVGDGGESALHSSLCYAKEQVRLLQRQNELLLHLLEHEHGNK